MFKECVVSNLLSGLDGSAEENRHEAVVWVSQGAERKSEKCDALKQTPSRAFSPKVNRKVYIFFPFLLCSRPPLPWKSVKRKEIKFMWRFCNLSSAISLTVNCRLCRALATLESEQLTLWTLNESSFFKAQKTCRISVAELWREEKLLHAIFLLRELNFLVSWKVFFIMFFFLL